MRLALISLLMIPITLGCDGDENKAAADADTLATERPAFEYKMEHVNYLSWDLTMTSLGDAGWELVFARHARDPVTEVWGYESIFKRKKQPIPGSAKMKKQPMSESDRMKMKALGYLD